MVTLTLIHVALSVAAIGAGVFVVIGLLHADRLDRSTAFFLATTAATTATGFVFPFHGFLPVHGVGIGSVIVLAAAVFARYKRRMAGPWRAIYVLSAIASLYLNVVVLVAQFFMKVPPLAALAPTLTERPFWIAQIAVGFAFAVVGLAAVRRFHGAGTADLQ
jgi:hypothetical protein